jgi:hypothetical protein
MNTRRAINSDRRTSGSSVSHHRAPPAHGPPQTRPGSTPHFPVYFRAQRSREVHPRLPPPGHITPGFGTPLQRPLPGPVTEREDSATSRVREACHCVNGQGQAGLHPQLNRPREELQPASLNTPGRSYICHAATALHKNYTLRPSHSFPCSLQHLSRHLRGGVMWEPPTM